MVGLLADRGKPQSAAPSSPSVLSPRAECDVARPAATHVSERYVDRSLRDDFRRYATPGRRVLFQTGKQTSDALLDRPEVRRVCLAIAQYRAGQGPLSARRVSSSSTALCRRTHRRSEGRRLGASISAQSRLPDCARVGHRRLSLASSLRRVDQRRDDPRAARSSVHFSARGVEFQR